MKICCKNCGIDCGMHYHACDEVPGFFCCECFELQPCQIEHGEGCKTTVYQEEG
jgi:hypothetical protein